MSTFDKFVQAINRDGHREDQLRELLSYCRTQDGRYMTPAEAYRDVVGKLAGILDGESEDHVCNKVTALGGDNQSLGYFHCGICGRRQ